MAGPLVRSSYRAGRLWATAMRKWGREIPAHLAHLAAGGRVPGPPGGGVVGGARRRAPYPDHHGTQQGRRRSSPPGRRSTGRLAQIRDVYRVCQGHRPGHRLVDAAVVPRRLRGARSSSASCVKLPVIFGIFGVLFGVLAATIMMSRRAERAAYSQIEGQAGAAGAALTSIRRGWYTDREPVAADVAASRRHQPRRHGLPRARPPRRRPRRRGPDRSACRSCSPPRRSASSGSPPACPSRRCASAAARARCRSQDREQGPAPQAADHQGRDGARQQAPQVPRWPARPAAPRASTRPEPAWTGKALRGK